MLRGTRAVGWKVQLQLHVGVPRCGGGVDILLVVEGWMLFLPLGTDRLEAKLVVVVVAVMMKT